MLFEPVIKWSGSKRPIAASIIARFPKKIKTYYEPFCGGASVFRRLVDSGIEVEKYVVSDINADLIEVFKGVKSIPERLSSHYRELWEELNQDEDLNRKKIFLRLRA